jgi:hypothetical protein
MDQPSNIFDLPIGLPTSREEQASILGHLFEVLADDPATFAPLAFIVAAYAAGALDVHPAHFNADESLKALGLARNEHAQGQTCTAYAGRDYDPLTGSYLLDASPFDVLTRALDKCADAYEARAKALAAPPATTGEKEEA